MQAPTTSPVAYYLPHRIGRWRGVEGLTLVHAPTTCSLHMCSPSLASCQLHRTTAPCHAALSPPSCCCRFPRFLSFLRPCAPCQALLSSEATLTDNTRSALFTVVLHYLTRHICFLVNYLYWILSCSLIALLYIRYPSFTAIYATVLAPATVQTSRSPSTFFLRR